MGNKGVVYPTSISSSCFNLVHVVVLDLVLLPPGSRKCEHREIRLMLRTSSSYCHMFPPSHIRLNDQRDLIAFGLLCSRLRYWKGKASSPRLMASDGQSSPCRHQDLGHIFNRFVNLPLISHHVGGCDTNFSRGRCREVSEATWPRIIRFDHNFGSSIKT